MEPSEDVINWMADRYDDILGAASDGEDAEQIVGRLRGMQPIPFDFTSVEHHIIDRVRFILEQEGFSQRPVTVNIEQLTVNSIVNSPDAVIEQAPTQTTPAAPEPEAETKDTFYFRMIQDDRLDLSDRIVFSFLWNWAWQHRKHPTTIKREELYRLTGFRRSTIKACIQTLITYKYISADKHEPLTTKDYKTYTLNNGMKYFCYRPCPPIEGCSIKEQVFRGVLATSSCRYMKRAPWLMKCLGISEKSIKRYRAKQDGCPQKQDGCPKPNRTGVRKKVQIQDG